MKNLERSKRVLQMTTWAVYIAIIVTLTILNPLAFGPVQLRFADIFLFLPFFDKRFIVPAIMAVGLSNFFSPVGLIDVIGGMTSSLLAYGLFARIPNRYLGATVNSVVTGFWVGIMLHVLWGMPLVGTIIYVFIGSEIVALFAIWFLGKVFIPRLSVFFEDNRHTMKPLLSYFRR